jgi:hypothetical protein
LENEQTIILPEHNQVENEVSYVLNKIWRYLKLFLDNSVFMLTFVKQNQNGT